MKSSIVITGNPYDIFRYPLFALYDQEIELDESEYRFDLFTRHLRALNKRLRTPPEKRTWRSEREGYLYSSPQSLAKSQTERKFTLFVL